jgi:hypothetical protein
MNQKTHKTKYRPVLTLEQMKHIISLAKATPNEDSISVISTLYPYIAKAEMQAIVPAYTIKEKPTLETKLGFSHEEITAITGNHNHISEAMDKEVYWKLAYEKWLANPDSCTTDELLAANEHRYLHDLMTPEEMVEFEKSMNNS